VAQGAEGVDGGGAAAGRLDHLFGPSDSNGGRGGFGGGGDGGGGGGGGGGNVGGGSGRDGVDRNSHRAAAYMRGRADRNRDRSSAIQEEGAFAVVDDDEGMMRGVNLGRVVQVDPRLSSC